MARRKIKLSSKSAVSANVEINDRSENIFRPAPFVLEKKRGGTLSLKSKPIDWTSLTPEETESQRLYCSNVLWELEKEGIISRSHLEPYFYSTLAKSGYSKEDIQNIKKLKEWQVPFALLKIPFLLSMGMRSKPATENLLSKITKLIDEGKKIEIATETKVVKPRKTIQEAMREQLSTIIGEIQGFEDEMFDKKQDMLKWFQGTNIPKAHVSAIDAYYRPRLDELRLIGKDDQITEAYDAYSKKQIRLMKEWYESLLTDLDAYKRVKQSQRKVRVRKSKTPTQLVTKLKYLSYSDDYKIQSIKPESIIGSNTLWLFNTKNRKLCVYVASELNKELTIKGSTILGWDPKLSIGKTLRKPESQLKEFMNGGKVAMRNFHKEIRGKEAFLNGRINKDMLLLKVY